jgi:hypothetical protein
MNGKRKLPSDRQLCVVFDLSRIYFQLLTVLALWVLDLEGKFSGSAAEHSCQRWQSSRRSYRYGRGARSRLINTIHYDNPSALVSQSLLKLLLSV